MIQSVSAIDCPPFYDRHGPKVLLLPGFVGEPRIAPGDLDAVVPQKRLQTLQAHPRIEKLAGKGVSQTVNRISLMGQSSSLQISIKHHPSTAVAECVSPVGIEEKLLLGVSPVKPALQGISTIIAEIHDPATAGLCPFTNGDSPFINADVTDPGRQQLADPHPGSQKHQDHSPIPDVLNNRKEPSGIGWIQGPRQILRQSEPDLSYQNLWRDDLFLNQKANKGMNPVQFMRRFRRILPDP